MGKENPSHKEQNWLIRNKTKITHPAGGAAVVGLIAGVVGAPISMVFASQSEPALEKSLLKLAEIEAIGGGGLIVLGGLTFAIAEIVAFRVENRQNERESKRS